jgi:hypothetical protein
MKLLGIRFAQHVGLDSMLPIRPRNQKYVLLHTDIHDMPSRKCFLFNIKIKQVMVMVVNMSKLRF